MLEYSTLTIAYSTKKDSKFERGLTQEIPDKSMETIQLFYSTKN